jgi:hypothetical protein
MAIRARDVCALRSPLPCPCRCSPAAPRADLPGADPSLLERCRPYLRRARRDPGRPYPLEVALWAPRPFPPAAAPSGSPSVCPVPAAAPLARSPRLLGHDAKCDPGRWGPGEMTEVGVCLVMWALVNLLLAWMFAHAAR